MKEITITQPDDFHLHLRDDAAMASVVADSARQFARAIVMPNLRPPITTVKQALSYRQRIIDNLLPDSIFEPLMTLYLTDNTSTDEIRHVAEDEYVHAVKYYPSGATTNSDQGVTSIEKVNKVFEKMSEFNIPLLVHGEVTDSDIDIFDREKVFIEQILSPLMDRFAGLRIVFEHITTIEAADFVREGPGNLAATITPQHLMYNRNEIFERGICPHLYCLPVLKREVHRLALVEAATSGHKRFFLGTDSAPHAKNTKETACGCAGIYSAHSAIEFYTEIFEQAGCLENMEKFASFNGADFYGLPKNKHRITIRKENWRIPDSLPFADNDIIPLRAGKNCQWKIVINE